MFCSGRERDQVAQRREPGECLTFELADALSRQVELVPDRLERPRLAFEPEPQLEDPPLTRGKRIERATDALAAQRLFRLVERIGGFTVGEQVAELAFVVGAHRLVQRHGRLCRAERLVDMLDRQSRRVGELVLRRLAIETTRRRFDSIIRRFATGSPRSIALASVTSSAAVRSLWRPTSARKS